MGDFLPLLVEVAGGSATVLILAVALSLGMFAVGTVRGWWVPRRQYEDVLRDRDFWRNMATRGAAFAERALEPPAETHG